MAGFIYIMSNPSFPNLLKIGKSNKDPTKYRAKELYSTGVPKPYKVEYYAFVEDETYLEQIIHKEFNEERVNDNREFFDISCETVVKFIRSSPDLTVHIKYEELLNDWNQASELDWDAELEFEKVFGPPTTFPEYTARRDCGDKNELKSRDSVKKDQSGILPLLLAEEFTNLSRMNEKNKLLRKEISYRSRNFKIPILSPLEEAELKRELEKLKPDAAGSAREFLSKTFGLNSCIIQRDRLITNILKLNAESKKLQ